MLETHRCKKCGKLPEIYKWSATFTAVVRCECGNRSDDCTSDNYEWAKIKAIRNWNKMN